MGLDKPPQTTAEALGLGWTSMSLECRRCKHSSRIDPKRFDVGGWRDVPIAYLFARTKCSACGGRPTYARLALPVADGWHEKRIDFFEGRVIRPSRE